MSGIKTFGAETLTAADVNNYLMRQAVLRFATYAALISAVPTPEPGMLAYAADTGYHYAYDGVTWAAVFRAPATSTVTFKSGYKAYDNALYPVQVTRRNGEVLLSGLVSPNSGNFAAGANVDVMTLPVGFRPTYPKFCAGTTPQGAAGCGLRIDPDGTVAVRYGNVASSYAGIDSVLFSLTN